MSLNLATIPLKSAKDYPALPAMRLGPATVTYEQLASQILAFASALSQQGIATGAKVALLLPSVPQFTISYFAILAAGGVVAPLNVLFTEDEIRYHVQDSDAVAIIVWDAFLEKTLPAVKNTSCNTVIACRAPDSQAELPAKVSDFGAMVQNAMASGQAGGFDVSPTNADDTAVILYTSGTTGRPKGAELSHFNLYDNARYVSEKLMRAKQDSLDLFGVGHVALAALPLFHSFGQTVIQNASLMHGATISLLPRFTPKDAAMLIQAHKVTFFAGVPTMYIGLLHDANVTTEQFATLKYAVSGGAALPVDVLNQFRERFGISILEGYGLSETSPVACFNTLMKPQKPGTVGPAIDLCEVKIVDESRNEVPAGQTGEIIIRGSNVMKRYYKRDDATRDVLINGWFYTGDIGKVDNEGYVSIVDRKKEMIIRGGFNVYPREVEEVVYQHGSIAEAAIIGVPDAVHGEEVIAVVALKPGRQLEHEQLEQFCREHLAAYKVPRRTIIMDSLPKGPTGKILKRLIKEQISG
ncbi:MAG: long-chain fatty acid--CoA ligase [Gammaproteobacteria bacterium]|nr:long-chain fatty acid--CoA ligase [Gammaproteobacteria bacterium]